MSIRIYSKKAFQFGVGANKHGDIDCFVTVPGAFQDMPEKYTNDKMFKLAIKTGSVSVIDKAAKQIAHENEPTPTVEVDPIKNYKEKLKTMDRDSTLAEAEKYGVKADKDEKLGQLKNRIFEAYKISVADSEE